MKCQLLVPGAGMGLRLGHSGPKALINLAGLPLVVHTLRVFQKTGLLAQAIVMVTPGKRRLFEDAVQPHFPDTHFQWVEGGETRQDSVRNALAKTDGDTELVIIHDAARPFVTTESIKAVIDTAHHYGAATLASRCSDTIFESDRDNNLVATPSRDVLWAGQTPQAFRKSLICKAHRAAEEQGFQSTDDATLVRRTGTEVKIVEGPTTNFKITTVADLELASRIIGERSECSELV